MFEINVTIKCPDLLLAATAIAAAFKPGTRAAADTQAPAQTRSMPVPAAPAAAPTTPVSAPVDAQAPVCTARPAVPAPSVAPMAPTAPAPSFTLDQVGKAGADLIAANPSKMPELVALLQQFGVPAITQLTPDQIGSFATALRGLGARI